MIAFSRVTSICEYKGAKFSKYVQVWQKEGRGGFGQILADQKMATVAPVRRITSRHHRFSDIQPSLKQYCPELLNRYSIKYYQFLLPSCHKKFEKLSSLWKRLGSSIV
jgi:hypothetical protein